MTGVVVVVDAEDVDRNAVVVVDRADAGRATIKTTSKRKSRGAFQQLGQRSIALLLPWRSELDLLPYRTTMLTYCRDP